MSCCGQRRAAMTAPSVRQRPTSEAPPPPAPEPWRRPAPAASSVVLLRYTAEGTLAMRGPASQHPYLFSDRAATPVLASDADAFLRSGLLERAVVDPPAPEPALEFLAAVTPAG